MEEQDKICQDLLEDEEYWKKDMLYMRSCYPKRAKNLVTLLGDICDRMEYENSPMLIAYPDKESIYRMVEQIYGKNERKGKEKEDPFYVFDVPAQTEAEKIELLEKELLLVLLCDEMHRRRMRHYRRKKYIKS